MIPKNDIVFFSATILCFPWNLEFGIHVVLIWLFQGFAKSCHMVSKFLLCSPELPATLGPVMMSYHHVSERKNREHGIELLKDQTFTICTAQTHEESQKHETDCGPLACLGCCNQWHSTKTHDRTCESLKSKMTDWWRESHMYVDCSVFRVI